MKRLVLATLVATATLTAGASAFAGKSRKLEVKITLGTRPGQPSIAIGSLRSARASADTKQFIGCSIFGNGGQEAVVECFAQDKAGVQLSCTSFERSMADAVSMIDASSDLHISMRDGRCTSITVLNSSINL
jgi:hypothetical protein